MRRGVADRYSRTYAWCYQHDCFSDEELERIERLVAKIEPTEGITGGGLNKDIRRSTVRWINPSPTSGWLFTKVDALMNGLNEQFYGFHLWGYDTMQHTAYSEDDAGWYDWHIDMELGVNQDHQREGATRKLSASILLNDDFEGGEFQITEGRETEAQTVEMKRGSIIVFPSFIHHRVNKITKGTRRSLVVWALGPKFV
jgi:PKHD-type hydroxylase